MLSRLAHFAIVGLYPNAPAEVGVKFHLYSCESRYRPYVMQWNVSDGLVLGSGFDPNKRTVFIVHGFRGSYDEMNWMGVCCSRIQPKNPFFYLRLYLGFERSHSGSSKWRQPAGRPLQLECDCGGLAQRCPGASLLPSSVQHSTGGRHHCSPHSTAYSTVSRPTVA